MHLAFFTHTYPAPNSNGGAEICYTYLKELKRKGVKVSLFIYAVNEYYEKCLKNYEKIKLLAENIHIFNADRNLSLLNSFIKKPWSIVKPADELILPAFKYQQETHKLLDQYNPDKIFIYDWYACPPVYNYKKEKILIVGDLLFYPNMTGLKYRKYLGYNDTLLNKLNIRNFIRNIGSRWMIFFQKKMQKKLFSLCEYGGSFGKFDADWLRKSGINHSKYYPTPYLDTSNENFLNFEKRYLNTNKKFKIATSLGRLNATATSSGLYLILNEILPILNQKLGEDNYEIHVYGDGYLRGSLSELKKKKNVFIRGYVDDIDKELLSSDVFLLASSVHLGYRCRLINCLARGLPIVIHKNDSINQPEFINEHNCMIGENSDQIVNGILKILNEKNLRKKIMIEARNTYLKYFEPKKAISKILSDFNK